MVNATGWVVVVDSVCHNHNGKVKTAGWSWIYSMTHPKITAFQSMMLFSDGAPLTPVGGSS